MVAVTRIQDHLQHAGVIRATPVLLRWNKQAIRLMIVIAQSVYYFPSQLSLAYFGQARQGAASTCT